MKNSLIEKHPLGFFLPEGAKVLMLGSFPPKREKWSMNFYYPNFINDMWRIMGLVFFDDRDHFTAVGKKAFDEEKIRQFCRLRGIALGDTAEEVIRLKDNASDKFLEVVRPIDLEKVLPLIPQCDTLIITGQKSMDTFRSVISVSEPKIGNYSLFDFHNRNIRLYRMPSSSRAYPMNIMQKAELYKKIFAQTGMI